MGLVGVVSEILIIGYGCGFRMCGESDLWYELVASWHVVDMSYCDYDYD